MPLNVQVKLTIIEFCYLEHADVCKSNGANKQMRTLNRTPAHLDFSQKP